jgi:hypothetical protein
MNIEVIKSWMWKIVPVITAYLVGRGMIDQSTADNIGPVIDAVVVIAVTVPTIIRSIKTHKGSK